MYNKFLSYLIKEIRYMYNLTQKEFGEKIEKSEISIRKYESGDVKIPFTVLFMILKLFDINVGTLKEISENIRKEFIKNNILNENQINECLEQFNIDIAKIYKLNINNIDIDDENSFDTIKIILSNQINQYIEKYFLSLAMDLSIEQNSKILKYKKTQNSEFIKIKNDMIEFLNYNIEKTFKNMLKEIRRIE
ncbi:helix-turn-helix transcriptional regulator [Fusobacterium polymorphum]|uniref:HTH cro/C1-type domain-containing protein n=1 Tax=Fusobacterium nucleatum subsp. polymorphum TaxID=76857 RepID=A0A2C6C7Y5_FUSNP|nr:helix-turn-helix transcriptional regulator [Fusobacterium polymorphum]PHI14048.1 hypothetical protein CBG59_10380 [Fusobacterium polymorphum]